MLIGRTLEIEKLKNAAASEYAEFVAIYGRRRVGKTFLVREFFNYNFCFQHSGMANTPITGQLGAFQNSLKEYGLKNCPKLTSWAEAFESLKALIKSSRQKKKVIFIDEIAWMDTAKSNFVPCLEHFWNSWASARKDILLVICASATSWIINKVLKNRGGLHNRVTYPIPLYPFTLHECEEYVQSRHIQLTRKQISTLYMVIGGVAFYWSLLTKGLSDAQIIDNLFFAHDAQLKNEFSDLYSSLFKSPDIYIKIITALGLKGKGLTRNELLSILKLKDNGSFGKRLEELEHCGFIRKYGTFGKKTKDALYQLVDNYTLFYFHFILKNKNSDEAFWSNSLNSQMQRSWAGLAFERLCLHHIPQIKKKIGISGVSANCGTWHFRGNESYAGTQIDLLIDRKDNVINLCEMKWYSDIFTIDKKYDAVLRNKVSTFIRESNTKKSVHLTMVTTYGINHNQYANEVHNEVLLDDLFAL